MECRLGYVCVIDEAPGKYKHNPTRATGQEVCAWTWIMPEDDGANQGRGRSPEAIQARP